MLPVEIAIEGQPDKECSPRPYLGMSMLGTDCPRALWYYFRWAYQESISPRAQRIFDRGNLEEARIIRDLNRVGAKFVDEQTTLRWGKHIKGHVDAIMSHVPGFDGQVLVEFKTASSKNFKKYKDGVKKANPKYYDQVVTYLHLLGFERALFIVTNKDDESRHYEKVEADPERAQYLLDRAVDIVNSDTPPPRISEDSSVFACKFCPGKDRCHNNERAPVTCRTCAHVSVNNEKDWTCELNESILTNEQQERACPRYEAT